ncbi:MAG TPA: Hsp20/alpha crystallin family protein [Actinomycetota bacterium]|nr:Hsp20/alpha crystallin family protein [Actinomycetota bacterium]
MVTRWDPFRDLLRVQEELNRLFSRTFGPTEGSAGSTLGAWAPLVDVYETPERFVVAVELPGVAPDDVDVSVEDSTLTVKGERRFYRDVREEAFHRVERRFGPFTRSLALPSTADTERIQASFENGVLMIEVPKVEAAKPRKIQVKAKA